jgi:hypothetical protein
MNTCASVKWLSAKYEFNDIISANRILGAGHV